MLALLIFLIEIIGLFSSSLSFPHKLGGRIMWWEELHEYGTFVGFDVIYQLENCDRLT
jgi:hypothetical protein